MFPTFTRTGAPITLATQVHATDAAGIGSGWAAPADTTGAWVSVSGCSYPE
jgi:glucan 1,3-beta-glucosidase